jgi:hypothetical protein
MRLRRRGRTLRRRYGGHMHRREAGARPVDEMLLEQVRETVRAPRMTMREMVERDRIERMLLALTEAESRR